MTNIIRKTICVIACITLMLGIIGNGAMAFESANANIEHEYTSTEAELQSNSNDSFQRLELYVKSNESAGLERDVKVDIKSIGGNATLYLPGKVDAKQLYFSWDDKHISLSKDGNEYQSGTAPVAPAGSSIAYTLNNGTICTQLSVKTIKGSIEVEPMFLDVNEELGSIDAMNSDSNHETKCFGTVRIGNEIKNISLKGRGNSTWLMEKKPYNMTVYSDDSYSDKKKAEFIEGVKSKKWTLLANYFDNSLLRNKIAQDLADELGIGLKSKFVDVWMNGEYIGNYLMTPKTDYNTPDDGYFLENDNYEEVDNQFSINGLHTISGSHNLITIKDIGKNAQANGETAETVEEWFTRGWNAVLDYDSEEYQKYFDLDSWAKMFLMYEVSKTYSCFSGSLFMHRDGLTESDKLIAGPAWDYDIAFGRTLHKFLVGVSEPMQMNAEGWYIDSIGFQLAEEPVSILQALGKHPSFMKCVANVFNENKWAFENIENNISIQSNLLNDSANMNNEKYGTNSLSGQYVVAPTIMNAIGSGDYALNYEVTTSWGNYVNNLREYCQKRVLWLGDHLAPGEDIYTTRTGLIQQSDTGLLFADVHTNDWFVDAVKYVSDRKIMTGTTETTFEPQTNVTRAMVVQILYALEGKPEGVANAGLTDVSEGAWYADAVNWAKSNKVVGGYPDNTFHPDEDISREQLAVILKAYVGEQGIKGADLQSFNDTVDISEWAVDAVAWAVGTGLIAGRDNGMLAPRSGATRAEVAQIMKNFCEKFGK